MRAAFVRAMESLLARDSRVWLLTSDTGFHVLDDLRARYHDRVVNCGISESAMIGIAAGLAMEGRQVFVYAIAPFATFRCFEHIRVDLCMSGLPVKIVGVGGGLVYGPSGPTHHAIEDIAVMTALPGMTVLCPGDPFETEAAVAASVSLPGPCYLRLGKSGEPAVHPGPLAGFRVGRAIPIRSGQGLALLATGNMLPTAIGAGNILAARGLKPAILSMPSMKPFDTDAVRDVAQTCRIVATIEEHSVIGGLGSAVCAALATVETACRVIPFGVPDRYADAAWSQDEWRARYGLTPDAIAERLIRECGL